MPVTSVGTEVDVLAGWNDINADLTACTSITSNPDRTLDVCNRFLAAIPNIKNRHERLMLAAGDSSEKLNALFQHYNIDTLDRGYAFAFRSVAHYQRGDLESALIDLNHAIALVPHLVYHDGKANVRDQLLLRRGQLYLETEEYDRAEADFRAVLKVNFVPEGHSHLASLYFSREQYDRALGEIELTLKRRPEDAVAYSMRGRIALKQKRYQDAVQDCQRAVQLTQPPKLAPNAERCIEDARKELSQISASSQPKSE